MIGQIRRRSGGMHGGALPYDAELPFLCSDSRAYIDTGVAGDNDNLEIYIEYLILGKIGYEGILGNEVSEAANSWRAIIYNDGLACNVNNKTGSGTAINNIPYTISKCSLRLTKQKIISNGAEVTAVQTAGTANNTNIALFNRRVTNPQFYNSFGLVIYLCKIYDNGVLIRDYIPVRVGNEGCMYDKVNNVLYYSIGTEKFAVPTKVEYIENTGTGYLVTSYVPTGQNITIRGKFYLTSYSGNYAGWFWGYTAETNNTYRIIKNGNDSTVAVNCGTRASNGSTNITINGLNNLYEFELGFNYAKINGQTYQLSTTNIGSENTRAIYLWANQSVNLYARGRWYEFECLDGDVLKLNLTPYRIGNFGFFYDSVSKEYIPCRNISSIAIGNNI